MKIKKAELRWDSDSDPSNPGWILYVEYSDGSGYDYLGVQPEDYHAPNIMGDAELAAMRARALKWNSVEIE